jgi:hypothetical protein
MADASAFDYPFWSFEILLEWLFLRAGIPNDDEKIREHRRQALPEIARQAGLGRLDVSGWRCRLEFPDRIITNMGRREPIPLNEFIDEGIWPFRGQYVLTPRAMVPNEEGLAALPADIRKRVESIVSPRVGFRWAEVGDYLEGWRDLHVRKDQVHAIWSDAEPAANQIEKPALTHSGVPGRPTAKHLYQAELECRYAAGKMLPNVEAEAQELVAWLKVTYPDLNSGKARSVANNIRNRHRELRPSHSCMH